MPINLRIFLFIIILIYIFCIAKAVKHKKMRIGYLIFWSFIGLFLLICLAFPSIITFLAKLFGFEMPTNMLFSIAIFIIFYLIFDLTRLLTQEIDKNITQTQEISMLKKQLQDLQTKVETIEKGKIKKTKEKGE